MGNIVFQSIKSEIIELHNLLLYRLFNRKHDTDIVNQFHQYYYLNSMYGSTWKNTHWIGVPIDKCPTDLIVYQEIIYATKPDIIIECGTFKGGSALFLASICDLIDNGKIITIDVESCELKPKHKRITYLVGSSLSKSIIENLQAFIREKDTVMVILDSDHSYKHVFSEMKTYSKFVTKGNYMIVEDTNLNGHPVLPGYGPGPMEAVEHYLRENSDFVIDNEKEKLLLTFNPRGYLLKVN